MTKSFNKSSYKDSRKYLRNHPTFTEKLLWLHLRNKQLCGFKFRRQYSVDKYILDFYCPELKLAIEVDGITHESKEQEKYDRARQNYIEKFGIKFIRITDEEVLSNLDEVLEKIEQRVKCLDINS